MDNELINIIGDEKPKMLDLLIDILFGGTSDKLKLVKKILIDEGRISDLLFWNNFIIFLKSGNFSPEILRKLSQKLEEHGNSKNLGLSILKAIADVDTEEKSRCIANLTQSVIHEEITVDQYFRLIHTLKYLVQEDLYYIPSHITGKTILNDDHLDDYIVAGIIRGVDGGYVYTERAYDLLEFGIKRGEKVSRPKKIKSRSIISLDLDDSLFEN